MRPNMQKQCDTCGVPSSIRCKKTNLKQFFPGQTLSATCILNEIFIHFKIVLLVLCEFSIRKTGADKVPTSVLVNKINAPRFTLENDTPDPWNPIEFYGVAIQKLVMPAGTTSWSIWRNMDMRSAPEHTPVSWCFESFYDVLWWRCMSFYDDVSWWFNEIDELLIMTFVACRHLWFQFFFLRLSQMSPTVKTSRKHSPCFGISWRFGTLCQNQLFVTRKWTQSAPARRCRQREYGGTTWRVGATRSLPLVKVHGEMWQQDGQLYVDCVYIYILFQIFLYIVI